MISWEYTLQHTPTHKHCYTCPCNTHSHTLQRTYLQYTLTHTATRVPATCRIWETNQWQYLVHVPFFSVAVCCSVLQCVAVCCSTFDFALACLLLSLCGCAHLQRVKSERRTNDNTSSRLHFGLSDKNSQKSAMYSFYTINPVASWSWEFLEQTPLRLV